MVAAEARAVRLPAGMIAGRSPAPAGLVPRSLPAWHFLLVRQRVAEPAVLAQERPAPLIGTAADIRRTWFIQTGEVNAEFAGTIDQCVPLPAVEYICAVAHRRHLL